LQDSLDSEHQITKALPKMAKAAHSPHLKKAFETHLAETETQIEKLEQVFADLDMPPKRKVCEATKGLVKEGEEMIGEKDELGEGVLDAGLIACAQKVEHYEIASYGTLVALARILGYREQQKMLAEILKEEKETDIKLSKIAETSINQTAKAA